jgi:hypothetical protein
MYLCLSVPEIWPAHACRPRAAGAAVTRTGRPGPSLVFTRAQQQHRSNAAWRRDGPVQTPTTTDVAAETRRALVTRILGDTTGTRDAIAPTAHALSRSRRAPTSRRPPAMRARARSSPRPPRRSRSCQGSRAPHVTGAGAVAHACLPCPGPLSAPGDR